MGHMQKAVIALVLALVMLFAFEHHSQRRRAAIHDIGTDLDNPLVFSGAGIRAANDNSLALDEKVQAAASAFMLTSRLCL